MPDWMKLFLASFCFPTFKQRTGIQFTVPFDHETGEFKGRKHKGSFGHTYTYIGYFEHYVLKVLEIHRCIHGQWVVTHNLIIEGSLHKNSCGGSNYSRFTFSDLVKEIYHLCRSLYLDPLKCIIQNIEIGVNVVAPFVVSEFISDNLLMYSTVEFVDYLPGKDGISLGRRATMTQYVVKFYNKGLQYTLANPMFRLELHYNKMQPVAKFGVNTLADLLVYDKVKALAHCILIKAWDLVLVCDNEINYKEQAISLTQKQLLREGCNRDYWIRLHKNSSSLLNKRRARFRTLTVACSEVDKYKLIKELIVEELSEIFKQGTFLPGVEVATEIIPRKTLTNLIKEKIDPDPSESLSINQPEKETVIASKKDIPEKTLPDATGIAGCPDGLDALEHSEDQEHQGPIDRKGIVGIPAIPTTHTTTVMTAVTPIGYPEAAGIVSLADVAIPIASVQDHHICHSTHLRVVDEEGIQPGPVGVPKVNEMADGIPAEALEAHSDLVVPRKEQVSLMKKLCNGLIKLIRQRLKPP